MIRINLLPIKAAQKKEKLKGQLMVAGLALVVTCGLCAMVYMHFLGKVQDMQAEIDNQRLEISRLMKTIGEVNQFKKRQKELRAKLDVLDQLKEARSGPVYLLDELYEAIPDKLWLTMFKESNGKASIQGVGVSEETVALFMRDLENSEYYSDVVLKVTRQKESDGIKFQSFEITCSTANKKPDVSVQKNAKRSVRGT